MTESDQVRFLDLDDLLRIADRAVGGQALLRDVGLLESAAARMRASVVGLDAYPSLEAKAAALLESLVRDHPLVDGNKRLGWLALYAFLGLNGYQLEVDDGDAYETVIAVAEGRLGLDDITARIARWIHG